MLVSCFIYGNTEVDYILQQCGTTKQPVHVHVDDLSKYHGKVVVKTSEPLKDAAPSSRKWEVDRIIDEREAPDGTKEYEIVWLGYDQTSWEPEANLNFKGRGQANPMVKWYSLTDQEKKHTRSRRGCRCRL